ncbi:MAG: rubrerythrin family protein [Acidobacteriota bacterium]
MTAPEDSQTRRNLLATFAGECQAATRYAYYAKQAGKEGQDLIRSVFLEISGQEGVHAKRFLAHLGGGGGEAVVHVNAAPVGSVLENLRAAVTEEAAVSRLVYPGYARTAREEGLGEIALLYENIAKAEARHAARLSALAAHLSAGTLHSRTGPVPWYCRHCGWTTQGLEAPERCPACAHHRGYFQEAPALDG